MRRFGRFQVSPSSISPLLPFRTSSAILPSRFSSTRQNTFLNSDRSLLFTSLNSSGYIHHYHRGPYTYPSLSTLTQCQARSQAAVIGNRDMSRFAHASRMDAASRVDDDEHIAHVKATFNNTLLTITDSEGKTLGSTSSGACGFKGAKRGTPYAAQVAGGVAAKIAQDNGASRLTVKVKGIGAGRLSAIKGLASGGMTIVRIADVTPIPHNGTKPRKARKL